MLIVSLIIAVIVVVLVGVIFGVSFGVLFAPPFIIICHIWFQTRQKRDKPTSVDYAIDYFGADFGISISPGNVVYRQVQ
jgi:MFS superfamily sulfate permease-like transporter